MSVTDPLADAFVKVKNASSTGKKKVDIKSSRMLLSIVDVLKSRGYIQEYKFIEDNKQGIIRLYLRYEDKNTPALTDIRRISRPGRRVYVDKNNIPKVLNGVGLAVISTSRGVMTDFQARGENIGGEVICYVF